MKQTHPVERACPKCSGRGTLLQVTFVPGSNLIRLDPEAPPVKCDRCKGKGVVLVRR